MIDKLISISSKPIGQPIDSLSQCTEIEQIISTELFHILLKCNGFYAFENSLHIFPLGRLDKTKSGYDILTWNNTTTWKQTYGTLADDFYFAEDVFGFQWFLNGKSVWNFDPETGDKQFVAHSMNDWAEMLLKEHRVMTGWPLAHEWQLKNRPLMPYERLLPKRLFVLGGKFEISNLVAVDSAYGMRARSAYAMSINSLPDGTNINFGIIK